MFKSSKLLKLIIGTGLLLVVERAAQAQCSPFVLNPVTGQLNCGGFTNKTLSNLSGTVAVNIPIQFGATGNMMVFNTSQNLQMANSSQIFLQGGKIIGTAGSNIQSTTYNTESNCASSGGTCSTASAGAVSIAAAATTVTVTTTAVHTNSVIMLGMNSTLGATLGVTCNTTAAFGNVSVSTVTNNTSFVITVSTAPTTNPLCLQYWIVN